MQATVNPPTFSNLDALLITFSALAVVIVGSFVVAPFPSTPKPPGVYSFVTGLPKQNIAEFKDDDRIPVRLVPTTSYRLDVRKQGQLAKPRKTKKKRKRLENRVVRAAE